MENKYYELIVECIKSHRKFAGLEDILDDIVSDVYEHVNHALTTITDESIINSYIQKVVSTSIITVPKKLGIKNRTPKKSINDILPVKETNVAVEECLVETTEDFVDDDTGEDVFEEIVNTEIVDEEEVFDDLKFESEETSTSEEEVLPNENSANSVVDDEISDFVDIIEEPEFVEDFQVSEDVHKGFVEKMINGVAQEVIPDDSENELNLNDIDSNEDSFDDLLVLDDVDDVVVTEEDSLELIEDFDAEVEISTDNEDAFVVEAEAIQNIDTEFVKPSYVCFHYEPSQNYDIDVVDLSSDINELNEKYPDLQIKTIMDLKYNKKMTIEQIVNELGVTKEVVIEALCELADVIRG